MEKKLVFISHITEEKDLAKIISDEIKKAFLGMFDTFVSSDGESIPAGSKWLDNIDEALNKSVIQISLCSPKSISRPWINFEAGSSWIRRVPIISLCHSGLNKNELPIPLSLLQAVNSQNEDDLKEVFRTLAKVLESDVPQNIDYKSIVSKITDFEKDYTYTSKIKQSIHQILNVQPKLSCIFIERKYQSVSLEIEDYKYHNIADSLEYLKKQNLISITGHGATFSNLGNFKKITITTSNTFNDLQLDLD